MNMNSNVIFDVFCYNGEPIVKLRLEMLAPVVDRFYIVESRVTFSGISKPVLFKDVYADLFAKYEEKITFIILDAEDFRNAAGNAWRCEEAQRNAPLQRIKADMAAFEKRNPYLIIVSDVDEIPRPEIITMLRSPSLYEKFRVPIALHMEFFYYNFAWLKKFTWTHPFIVSEDGVQNITTNLDTMRMSPKSGYIANAGWHCSYMESIDNIVRKIESFSHQEHNTEGIKSRAYIAECMGNGTDLFARGPREDLVAYDWSKLPAALQEFHHQIKLVQGPDGPNGRPDGPDGPDGTDGRPDGIEGV